MGDKNDFWKSSDDDFWSKPVVSDDWLSSKEEKQEQTAGEEQPAKQEQAAGEEQPAKQEQALGEEQPAKQEQAAGEEQSAKQEQALGKEQPERNGMPEMPLKEESAAFYGNPYAQQEPQKEFGFESKEACKEDRPQKQKTFHIHTIICAIFIFLAAASMASAFIAADFAEKRAVKKAKDVSFEEAEVGNSFLLYENNRIYLEDKAYTVKNYREYSEFPEDSKLIAVYVEVESDTYISSDTYAFKHCYIGYEKNGRMEYRLPVRGEIVLPYFGKYDITYDDILNTYGGGNGSDSQGYFCFFVPQETEDVIFFMEEREERKDISYLRKVCYKPMTLQPERMGIPEMYREVGN